MSLLHQIALAFSPGIGAITARTLIQHFGTAEEVFSVKKSQLTGVSGIGEKTAASIQNKAGFERAEKELKFIERYKIKVLSFESDDYPRRLKTCFDAPYLLYFKGNADLNAPKIISIVGTRNATEYGKALCEKLLEDLQPHSPVIISGLAYGIDSMAHKEAVKTGIPTVGVVGHGLDRIYPAAHRSLAEKMLNNGGLLTEFPSETNPDRENFPKRNRIIAGLSDATIVVEASIKGGALITAEIANSYNKDVFAFPGKIDQPFSEGCNYLIKTNRANLITCVSDLKYILGWDDSAEVKTSKPQLSLSLNLSAEEKKVVEILEDKGQIDVDNLAFLTKLSLSKLAITVLKMEMQGLVIALPGKIYKLA